MRHVIIALLLSAAACGGDKSTMTAPGVVSTVKLNALTGTIAVGAADTLLATAFDAEGNIFPGTATWQTSAPAAATVVAGVVTGVAPGLATITATISGKSAQAQIAVTASAANVITRLNRTQ